MIFIKLLQKLSETATFTAELESILIEVLTKVKHGNGDTQIGGFMMINIQKLIEEANENGYQGDQASAKVCQDIVLKSLMCLRMKI